MSNSDFGYTTEADLEHYRSTVVKMWNIFEHDWEQKAALDIFGRTVVGNIGHQTDI